MNPHARANLRYSLATTGIYLILIPIHEGAHLLVARLENLQVESYSLFSLSPSVVLAVPGSVWFFLSGPIIVMSIVGIVLIYSWKKPFRNYLLVLFSTELVADMVDFQATVHLLLR
jgi:hypothetical protein